MLKATSTDTCTPPQYPLQDYSSGPTVPEPSERLDGIINQLFVQIQTCEERLRNGIPYKDEFRDAVQLMHQLTQEIPHAGAPSRATSNNLGNIKVRIERLINKSLMPIGERSSEILSNLSMFGMAKTTNAIAETLIEDLINPYAKSYHLPNSTRFGCSQNAAEKLQKQKAHALTDFNEEHRKYEEKSPKTIRTGTSTGTDNPDTEITLRQIFEQGKVVIVNNDGSTSIHERYDASGNDLLCATEKTWIRTRQHEAIQETRQRIVKTAMKGSSAVYAATTGRGVNRHHSCRRILFDLIINKKPCPVLAICEGHYGRGAGDYIAQHLYSRLQHNIDNTKETTTVLNLFVNTFDELNQEILEDEEIRCSGASVTALIIHKGYVYTINSGDCCALLLNPTEQTVIPLNERAHKDNGDRFTRQIGRIGGKLDPDGDLIGVKTGEYTPTTEILRGFGYYEFPGSTCRPKITKHQLKEGEILFLCNSGFLQNISRRILGEVGCSILHQAQGEMNPDSSSPSEINLSQAVKELLERAYESQAEGSLLAIMFDNERYQKALPTTTVRGNTPSAIPQSSVCTTHDSGRELMIGFRILRATISALPSPTVERRRFGGGHGIRGGVLRGGVLRGRGRGWGRK